MRCQEKNWAVTKVKSWKRLFTKWRSSPMLINIWGLDGQKGPSSWYSTPTSFYLFWILNNKNIGNYLKDSCYSQAVCHNLAPYKSDLTNIFESSYTTTSCTSFHMLGMKSHVSVRFEYHLQKHPWNPHRQGAITS